MNKLQTKSLYGFSKLISSGLIGMAVFLSSCSSLVNFEENFNQTITRKTNQAVAISNATQNSQTNQINQSNQSQLNLSKAEQINNYIGFLDQNQINRIKNHNILGGNIHANQSIYNVAFFLSSGQYRNESHAKEEAIKEMHGIYTMLLSDLNLVLSDKKQLDERGHEVYKIQGVDCLGSLGFTCQVDFFTIDAKITQSPQFIHRNGGSYFIQLRVRLLLPKDLIQGEQFYSLVTERLPNWTFNLVDYEANQVVHIQRGYQKYFF